MRMPRPHGCLASLLGLLLFGVALVYAVAAITSPWSFHIGGRWTPLLYWSGSGKLTTKGGTYPLYVYFFPASHFSRLRLDGVRPAGGLQGMGWLCTSPGVTQRMVLSGTIYGSWSTTEGSLLSFRLLERNLIETGQPGRGYFDLYGRWQGPELVTNDRGAWSHSFRSGLRIQGAAVTFDWGSYSDFKETCANMPAHP